MIRTIFHPDGQVEIIDDGQPPPAPAEPSNFNDISPRDIIVAILKGLRSAGIIPSAAAMDTIRDTIIDQLKR